MATEIKAYFCDPQTPGNGKEANENRMAAQAVDMQNGPDV